MNHKSIVLRVANLRRLTAATTLVLAGVVLFVAAQVAFQTPAGASSHREAPMIAKDPSADNTDVYAFVAPDNPSRITLIANWIPLEAPEGGPNYYTFDETAYYDIYVDNDGDATPDITYTLDSKVTTLDYTTFLAVNGTVADVTDSGYNRRQYYTVTEYLEDGSQTVIVGNVLAPPPNIGSKATPNYLQLFEDGIYTVNKGGDEINVFAGPTDDPFFVDLQVFDLLTLRGQSAPIGYDQGNNIPVDSLSGYNVHSLAIEVPTSRLRQGVEPVLGVWAGTRRYTGGVFNPFAGSLVQVSRLGMPLVNEVVMPLRLKDAFNFLRAEQDLTFYFSDFGGSTIQKAVEDPELASLLCLLYGLPVPNEDPGNNCHTQHTPGDARSGRGDIFDIFLTGMVLGKPFDIETAAGTQTLAAGTNVNQPDNVRPAEMIRINTALQGTICKPTPSPLGILDGDACGFPNGRRLFDDVVDIELRAVAGAAYQVLDGKDPAFVYDPMNNDVLSDGVNTNDVPYRDTFPYLAPPHSGQSHYHQNAETFAYLPVIIKTGWHLRQLPRRVQDQPLVAAAIVMLLGLPFAVMTRRRK